MLISLIALPGWPLRSAMLANPVIALLFFCFTGALAGFATGGLTSHAGSDAQTSVRRGARAALSASLWAGIWIMVMVGTLPGWQATLKALLLPVGSVVPGTLVGSFAAALGAFQFRRRTVIDCEQHQDSIAEVPLLFRYCAWIGLVPAYAAAAISTLLPGRTTTSLIRSATQSVSQPQPSNGKDFNYEHSEALLTAHPYRWNVTATRELGAFVGRTLVLDHDQRRLAGSLSSNGAIVQITGLNKSETLRFPPLPFDVGHLAFNSKGDELLAVSNRQPRSLAILKCDGLKTILLPQPSKNQIPDDPIAWVEKNAVCFYGSQFKQQLLNLESLEITALDQPQREFDSLRYRTSPGMVTNDRWTFRIRTQMPTASMLPEVEGTPGWPVVLRERLGLNDAMSYSMRIFPEIESAEGDRWMGVQEGSILLRIRGTQVTGYYFGLRPTPPLRWKLQMPHGPEKLPNAESMANLLKGCEFRLFVYAPLTNPLTNKTVGPDRQQLKATLIISEWKDTEAECWLAIDYLPILAGNVVADLHVHSEERALLPLGSPQRWWAVLPDPTSSAQDQTQLPSRQSVTERQMEGEKLEAQRLALTKAKPNPPAAEVEVKQPDPVPTEAATETKDEVKEPLLQELTAYLENHHALATAGRIDELAQNYAEQVDHFNNGTVDRMFIFRDEFDYHQKYRDIRERVRGPVAVRQLSNNRIRVEYTMVNGWTKIADGTRGGGAHSVILDLVKQGDSWKIVRHRASKQP
ncbi:MAG: hypothetical protein ACKV19_09560 [Verrucomicrobiales bacterium]